MDRHSQAAAGSHNSLNPSSIPGTSDEIPLPIPMMRFVVKKGIKGQHRFGTVAEIVKMLTGHGRLNISLLEIP